MEMRLAKLVVNKSGSGSSTFRATLPTKWIRKMKLSEEDRFVNLEFKDNKIIISKERLEMLKLMVKDHGEEEVLKEGTLEEVLEYLKENEELTSWVLDEDPEMELPNFNQVENLKDLQHELDKTDLGWWALEIEEA